MRILKTGRLSFAVLILGITMAIPIRAHAEVDVSVVETDLENPREEAIVRKGLELVGVPYVYGGKAKAINKVPKGIDCSGVITYVYTGIEGNEDRVSLTDSSLAMAGRLTEVSYDDLKVGDICYVSKKGVHPNHVGMYIGKSTDTGNNLYLVASTTVMRVIVTEYNGFSYYYRPQM